MYQIHEADSRDMHAIDDDAVDLVVTSPPYNLNVEYDTHDDALPSGDYADLLRDVFAECYRVLRPDGRMCVNVGIGAGHPVDDKPAIVKRIATEDVGFRLRDKRVWDKGDSEQSSAWGSWRSASNPRTIFNHEEILTFYPERPGRDDTKAKTLTKPEFMRYVKSVWSIKPERGKPDHPAPFPREVPSRLIKLYSYEGDTVLDPFAGTGTTIEAALDLDRHGIGYEVSPDYASLARKNAEAIDAQTSVVDF